MQIQNNRPQSFGALKITNEISQRTFNFFERSFGNDASRILRKDGYNYLFTNPETEQKALNYLKTKAIPYRQYDYPEMSDWDFKRFADEPLVLPTPEVRPKSKNPVIRTLSFIFMKQTPES